MNFFDRICAVAAFGLGIILLILGTIGLFTGSSANFTLPPLLGVLPAFIGWGIVRSIYLAWNVRKPTPPSFEPYEPAAPYGEN